MEKIFVLVILAIFGLWGCTPAGELNATAPSEKTGTDGTMPALREVDETPTNVTGPEESEIEILPAKPYPIQTGQVSMPADTEQAVTAIAPSGVIDLNDINQGQEAEGEGELIELPAPGVPITSTLLIETAKNDLAERLKMNLDDVTLVAVESEEWPDSSLGCPSQGTDSLPVLVDGYRITLEVKGETFIYHTDLTGKIILCEDG